MLLHGLARTAGAMEKLQDYLLDNDFAVVNIDYPSREYPIEALAPLAINKGLLACQAVNPDKIHFVTHSLGGILVRYYLKDQVIDNLGRVVMLGPPNGGSEVVDTISHYPGYRLLNGPAGMQLGTDAESIPVLLGPANFEVGIIAGTKSINLIFSMIIPSTDDGKVSLENAHLSGESGFIALPVSHPFLMKNTKVLENVVLFLNTGAFQLPL